MDAAPTRSRTRLAGILALLIVGACQGAGTTAAAQQTAAPAHTVFGATIAEARALVATAAAALPGVSVAVAVDDEIVWAEGFGWADLEQRVPVRPTSRFRVGSVSKPMTAALLGLLRQEGRVDLDAPVQTYVPDFPVKEFPITTRQLAGHLAGIRHYRGDEFLSAVYYPTVPEGLAIFADDPLLFEPGARYSYSSYGWNLLSAVIEGASGAAFLPQMQSRVFEALGMTDTTADVNALIVPERVRPYQRGPDGLLYNAPYVDNSYKWAGGGFLSTAADLVRFGVAHMRPGFLGEATLTEWMTAQTTNDGEATGYGIGWRVGADDAGRRAVGHTGGSVGGTTALMLFPDHGVVVAMISNMSGAGGLPAPDVAALFIEARR